MASTDQLVYMPSINTSTQVVTVRVPSTTQWQPNSAQQFMLSLFILPVPITLRLLARNEKVSWHLEVSRSHTEAVVNTIYTYYPEAHVVCEPKQSADIGYYAYYFHAAAPYVAPLKYAEDFKNLDPLAGILNVLTDLKSEDEVIYELVLKPITDEHYELGKRLITDSTVRWWHYLRPNEAIAAMIYKTLGWDKVDRFEPGVQRVVETKFNGRLKQTTLCLKIKTRGPEKAKYLLSLFEPGLGVFEREGFNFLVQPQSNSFPLVLSPLEVAALWHFPTQECSVPGIYWASHLASPLAMELDKGTKGVLLGLNNYQGRSREVRLPYEDRVTHINLIGKTRVGKSTLLHQMAHQDIRAGKGVAVIDPHGDLVEQILASSIPHSREQDVVLLDTADLDHVIGLNLLSPPLGVPREVAAGQALSVIRHLFAEQWSATRMEDALHAALIALMSTKEATLLDIPRLFGNEIYRAEVLSQVSDPVALEFWQQEYEPLSESYKREIARPINSRIRKFYRNETIRRMVCQPKCLDFREIIDSGKIFLANLRGATSIEGETLGALLISKIQMAAMSRATDTQRQREPYYLYVDEAQNFVTTSLSTMFSEAGKYGLSLVLANQFLHQLIGDTLEAVMGNVGTTIMFRVGPKDAQTLGHFVKPNFSQESLLNLSRFNAIIKMQHNAQTLPAFSVQTLPPLSQPDSATARVERIRSLSRERYSLSKVMVDAEIYQRLGRDTPGIIKEGEVETPISEVDYFD